MFNFREVTCFYLHLRCGPVTWQPVDLVAVPTVDEIQGALTDITAPTGSAFVLVDMSTTKVINQRDTVKINLKIRPPADDLESLATACGEAVAETFTGRKVTKQLTIVHFYQLCLSEYY